MELEGRLCTCLVVRTEPKAIPAHEPRLHLVERPVRVIPPEAASRFSVFFRQSSGAIRHRSLVDFSKPEAPLTVDGAVVEATVIALRGRNDLFDHIKTTGRFVKEGHSLVVSANVRAGMALAEELHRDAIVEDQLAMLSYGIASLRVELEDVEFGGFTDTVDVMQCRIRLPSTNFSLDRPSPVSSSVREQSTSRKMGASPGTRGCQDS
jgi:hypothetical protein